MILRDKNTEKGDFFRKGNESYFLIKNGSSYFGSFMGEKISDTEWVEEKIKNWR